MSWLKKGSGQNPGLGPVFFGGWGVTAFGPSSVYPYEARRRLYHLVFFLFSWFFGFFLLQLRREGRPEEGSLRVVLPVCLTRCANNAIYQGR